MKQLAISILLAGLTGVLCAGLALPVAADSPASSTAASYRPADDAGPAQVWRIRLHAQVVSNRGGALMVHLTSPQNMAVQEGDAARNLQVLPVTAATAVVDSAGGALAPDDLLPGQQAQITFRYRWQNSNPRTAVMVECVRVELLGETLLRKSTATVDDFARGTLCATVLAVQGNQLEVYVEAAKVFAGDTEWIAHGTQKIEVARGAVIVDAAGKKTTLGKIRPFQRVVLTEQEAVWMESFPPIYCLQSVSRIELLGEGEKLFAPSHLAGLEKMTARVLEVQGGTQSIKLLLEPVSGSREAGLRALYTLEQSPPDADLTGLADFRTFRPGDWIFLSYSGLNYRANPGVIAWCNKAVQVEGPPPAPDEG